MNQSPNVNELARFGGPDRLAETLDRSAGLVARLLRLQAMRGAAWGEIPLTWPRLRVLGLLVCRERGLSGRELAGLLRVVPSVAVPAIDQLSDLGLARRTEDAIDRRVTRFSLIPAGQHLLERIHAGRRDLMADVLRGLDAEELTTVDRAFGILGEGCGCPGTRDAAHGPPGSGSGGPTAPLATDRQTTATASGRAVQTERATTS